MKHRCNFAASERTALTVGLEVRPQDGKTMENANKPEEPNK
jgi:hypothetical protein